MEIPGVTTETVTAEELANEAQAAPAPEAVKRTRTKKTDEQKAAEKAEKDAAREAKKAEREANKKPAGPRPITVGLKTFNLSDVITLKTETNPKRGASAERFANYASGQTVQQALDAGLLRADIVWDSAHGYIEVSAPASE